VHYVLDRVRHEDLKTTREIYAMVQKWLSRPQVKPPAVGTNALADRRVGGSISGGEQND
jgi:hypothetical protein